MSTFIVEAMMRLPLRAVLPLLCACAGDAPRTAVAPDTLMIDGMPVLHHDATALERAPQWTVDTISPTIIDGDGDSRFNLLGASFIAALPDGRFLASRTGNLLLVFDSTGAPLARHWISVQSGLFSPPLLLPPDTLLSASYRNPPSGSPDDALVARHAVVQLAVLEDGTVLRQPMAAASPPCTTVKGRLPGAELLVQTVCAVADSGVGDGWLWARASRADRRLAVLESLFTFPAAEIVADTGALGWVAPQFGARGHLAVWGEWIVSATSDRYQLDLRGHDGRVQARLRVDRPREPVTEAIRAAAPRLRQQRARFSDSLPAFAALQVDHEGLLWVIDYRTRGDSGWSATAFRSDGAVVGRLRGAGAGRPVWLTRERVWIEEPPPAPLTPWFSARRVVPVR
ncbi:MAG: hypothetical protein R3B35_10390 [Gemmatimonadales bacterium]